jgi:hypothetical protein
MNRLAWIASMVVSAGLVSSPAPVKACDGSHENDERSLDWMARVEAWLIEASYRENEPVEAPISWRSSEGLERLKHARFKADFATLSNNYEAQINKYFCGPASSTIVLNSLRNRDRSANNPEDPSMVPAEAYQYMSAGSDPLFKRYTQNTFFNSNTDQVKTRLQVFGQPMPSTGKKDGGFQLHQLQGALEAHGLTVAKYSVGPDASRREVMTNILRNLMEPDNYVIVNFQRKAMGQTGGGHFSPVGAYDHMSRSFLVMDVNPMTADWVWVKANTLFNAMQTWDTVENRGYLLVSDPSTNP